MRARPLLPPQQPDGGVRGGGGGGGEGGQDRHRHPRLPQVPVQLGVDAPVVVFAGFQPRHGRPPGRLGPRQRGIAFPRQKHQIFLVSKEIFLMLKIFCRSVLLLPSCGEHAVHGRGSGEDGGGRDLAAGDPHQPAEPRPPRPPLCRPQPRRTHLRLHRRHARRHVARAARADLGAGPGGADVRQVSSDWWIFGHVTAPQCSSLIGRCSPATCPTPSTGSTSPPRRGSTLPTRTSWMSFTPTGRPGKTISNTYTYTIHTAVCFDHLIWRLEAKN